jgi:hypothetical protein
MSRIISELRTGKYVLLQVDSIPQSKEYWKYLIGNIEYDIVMVYDLPGHIAIETEIEESFVGKEVEFI